jgi:hypothetical protein|tara:strand:+ start:349 stop:627 length:279 start_codon:yes stop_codon:yes gene_type:complete
MNDDFFTVGPFKGVEKRVNSFSKYLYFNVYYNKTLVKVLELEEERELAVAIDDKERATALKDQIITYETMMLIAGNLSLSSSVDPDEPLIYD